MSDMQKVTVVRKNPDDINVNIKCPDCNFFKSFPVQKLKEFKKAVKVKCKCGNLFAAKIEFRRRFRKKTLLDGLYCDLVLAGSEKWKAYSQDTTRKNCHIVDISIDGVGIVSQTPHTISEGDKLRLRFELDPGSAPSPGIELNIIVRHVQGDSIGCEFLEGGKHRKKIGFFTMVGD